MRPVGERLDDPGAALDELCQRCADDLDVSSAGITLIVGRQPRGCVAATDETARRLEALQFQLGEGPCLSASAARDVVVVPDFELTDLWPAYTRQALDAGIHSVCALPLHVGNAGFGALQLYRRRAGLFERETLVLARELATRAVDLLLWFLASEQAGDVPSRIAVTVEQRAVVHQATGMIAAHFDVDLADALVLLRARSFTLDRPLAEVATAMVDRTIPLDPPEQRGDL